MSVQEYNPADSSVNGSLIIADVPSSTCPEEAASIQNVDFLHRFGDTANTLFRRELPEKGHRLHRLGALAVGVTTQVLDRGRAMIFALPWAFDNTLEYAAKHGYNGYQTATAAGLAVAGIFGAWGYIVGKSFEKSIDAFPATTQKVVENHPVMIGVISKAIDGFPTSEKLEKAQPIKPEEGYDVGPYDTRKTFLGKATLALTRGLKTGFLFGTTAHVGMAKVGEHSDKSNERRLRVVDAEASIAFGSIAAGLSTMITHNFLGIAEQVRDAITSKTNLAAATLLIIGSGILSNFRQRRKYIKNQMTHES